MSAVSHQITGRISAATAGHMVTLCSCGLAFFGESVKQADDRCLGHIQKITHRRQTVGDLTARLIKAQKDSSVTKAGLIGEVMGFLLKHIREE